MGYRTSIEKAALKTLEQLGYTWHEGELWKPPIGKSASPLLDKIDLLEARIAALTKDAEPVATVLPYGTSPSQKEAFARAQRERDKTPFLDAFLIAGVVCIAGIFLLSYFLKS